MILPGKPSPLPPAFQAWFETRGWTARRHQLEMVEVVRGGAHALLIAPTGGGKTLAGFLPSLIDLTENPRGENAGPHTLYISPLKALAVDVERNLMAPVREMGLPVTIESRTGDTPVSKKQRQKERPPAILLTTPEQLALFCAWEGARHWFADLKTVIIDEIHAIHGGKRGDLLNLGLGRLQSFAPDMRRIGLSATVQDPEMIRRWLVPQPLSPRMGGGDHAEHGEGGATAPPPPLRGPPPPLRGEENLSALVMGDPGAPPVVEVLYSKGDVPWSGWTAAHATAEVYDVIRANKTTLIFVNTRFQAEMAFQSLWEMNEDGLEIALHHGSLAAEQRRKVEAAMARGDLRAVVCTSTLDLGIDWGAVDMVVQLAAPKGSARLIQRIGRANHRMDEPSRALLVPAHRFEVLECRAAQEAVALNDLDGDAERVGAKDILAQHVMGVACGEAFHEDALFDEVRSCAPYRDLPREDFDRVVDFVSTGGYALRAYDRFRRIVGRDGVWKVRDGQVAQRHRMNIGAIVDIPMISIRVGSCARGGRKMGEMEESFIEQLTPGDTFRFGGQVWKLNAVEGMDAFVFPSPDPDPRVPSWGGSKFALSTYLAARVRRLIADEYGWRHLPDDMRDWLHVQKQRSIIPTEDEMLVETFQRGSRHYLVCYPFDGRISHGTLCQLLARRLERAEKRPLGFTCNDYALAIWATRPLGDLDFDALFEADMLGDDLEAWLDESVMMKRGFRQVAVLSGLIEKRFPGQEKSGRQVTFSTDLIYDVLRKHQPDHLLLLCARADATSGQLDVARLGRLLERIRGRITPVALARVSPFAVPVMLEIGREPVFGAAMEDILEENAQALIAEAMDMEDA